MLWARAKTSRREGKKKLKVKVVVESSLKPFYLCIFLIVLVIVLLLLTELKSKEGGVKKVVIYGSHNYCCCFCYQENQIKSNQINQIKSNQKLYLQLVFL